MAEVTSPILAKICLDVQICICMFLHPSDILAMRKTCKALQAATRKRVVWVDALHRVCFDNALFLPSFPISEMSDRELEKAAMAPRRWIELYSAFKEQHLYDHAAMLHPRGTRYINDLLAISSTETFIVPGGRYLVTSSCYTISVLDLGYTSSADCKLIASVRLDGGDSKTHHLAVQATLDGMGLVIFTSNRNRQCSVYEIYPRSETPHLTQVDHLDLRLSNEPRTHLLPGTVVWYGFYKDRVVFRVWDFRLNHSTSFSVDVDVIKFLTKLRVIATKTAVIVICEEAVLIYAIPPLSPQPPDFINRNPTHIPPLFTIPLPVSIILQSELLKWGAISSWYFGSSHPFYFDMLCRGSELHRFKLVVKPDLSDASLHTIASELTPHNFNDVHFHSYKICEDTLFSCWSDYFSDPYQCGVYTGLTVTSARSADVISVPPALKVLLPDIGYWSRVSWCPASGRFVLLLRGRTVAVLDFL